MQLVLRSGLWMMKTQRKEGTEQLKREMDMMAQLGCKRIAAPPAGATGSRFLIYLKWQNVTVIFSKLAIKPE